MKKIIMIAAAVAATVLSCTKETNAPSRKHYNTVLNAEQDLVTRTELASDGKTVNWLSGDKISVFDVNGSNCKFDLISSDGASASFGGNTEGASEGGVFYALYPYNASAAVAGAVISSTLPAGQKLKGGSFADGANIAVAKFLTDGSSSVFKNISSILKFVVPEGLDDIVRIEISSDEVIAGDFDVDLSGDEPAVTKKGSDKTIVLSNDGARIAPGTYYAELLPGTLDGISIKLVSIYGEEAIFSNTASVTLNKGRLRSIGTVVWDYKRLYDEGKTIYICGKPFSKDLYGASKELTATTADFDFPKNNDLGWAAMNTGVIFLDCKDGCNFTIANDRNAGEGKTIAFIGRYRGADVTVNASKQLILAGGVLAFKNLQLNRPASATRLFGQTAASEGLYIDDCEITDVNGNQFAYFGTASAGIRNLVVENSTFNLNVASGQSGLLFNASGCTAMSQYSNIVFRNNVFYNPVAARYSLFQCNPTTQTETAGGENVTIENNTLYNVCSGYNGLVYHNHIENLKVTKNLMHLNTTGFGFYVYKVAAGIVNSDVSDNYAYGLYSSSWVIDRDKDASGDNLIPRVNPYNDPLPGVVDAFGDYTPVAAYSGYGAVR